MGLRINTNVAALTGGRILNRSTQSLNTTLQRLGSGLRINAAKDDAAGLAIAEGFRSQVLGTGVASRNSQDGVSLAQTAEGALGETTNILQRVRELAVQASNGTVSTDNRTSLNNEVRELIAQIDDIAWDTEFNGIKILSAASQRVTLQTGANAGQTLIVSTSGAASTALGVGTLSISTMASASAALSTLDLAIRSVTSIRATLGAQQNRLEFTINTLAIQEENAAAAESAIRDADIARETIEFTRTQILVSAGTSVLAQANLVPQTALSLLG
jgi:flagellin